MDDTHFYHGGNIYEVKRKYKKDVIDFSSNINPLGLSNRAREEFIKSYEKILYYPDPEAKELRGKIAQYWKIREENILLGNGSSELIYLLASVLRPERTAIPAPTFSEYERVVRSTKGKIQFFRLKEEEGFALNLTKLSKIDMLFICNPNNPTGNLLIENRRIDLSFAKLILIDEAFLDFLPDEERHTFIWKATQDKRFMVLRTFTKIFALPGLRVGYLVAHPDIVNRLKKALPPWNINVFAQRIAEVMLSGKDYIEKTRELIRKERDFLYKEMDKIEGLKPYPSATNFFLVKIEDKKINSFDLTKKLIHRGIFVRNCWNFRYLGNRFVRIAVRSHSENVKLIKALRDILCKNSS